MKTPAHRRTVEEAIAQADAKDRIRTALGIRHGGFAMTVLGVAFLLRTSWRWRNPFAFSLLAPTGIAVIVVGLLSLAVGHWRLARAIKAAKSNPVTASVVRESLR